MLVSEFVKYRPPSESRSLLLRASRGCYWNRCGFCDMYRDTKFSFRPVAEIVGEIERIRREVEETKVWAQEHGLAGHLMDVAYTNGMDFLEADGTVRTAFIGDGDSLVMKTADLVPVVEALYRSFPTLERVTIYGMAHTIMHKTPADLRRLREAGLNRVHIGLESGADEVLALTEKGATQAQMIEAARRVKEAGMELSMYVILGLGGRERSAQHADGTAFVLNRAGQDFIRVRTLSIPSRTPLGELEQRGEFHRCSTEEILQEERRLIAQLECRSEFVSDHNSNHLALNGRLPQDRAALVGRIEEVLALPESARRRQYAQVGGYV
ncbi:MAG: radical SAM protein [Chloroflexi bacterium]|nr:radical SAM protein [Chloroflexota bacterium]